ncbi:NUDIX domain-containing protein [Nocardia wallacei]|uniref:NUDIX domain-containing protein n=1 Tax=Nocardia wallacei TaxID=480035 RepID=UPI0024544668|nr:NUDIX domain-containing protein [Nocardia wallacei]
MTVETFQWIAGGVPVGVPVVQVYGWLVDETGAVLIQDVGDGFNLPGGSPEPEDHGDPVATLKREALEESQVTVRDAVHLGYEVAHRDGRAVAFVRMAGRIGEFLPRQPDPDGGRLFRRLMAPLDDAPALLGWGHSGCTQASAVRRVASARWGLRASYGAAVYRD